MRFNERALLVGKTRSGKSTLARHVFAHMTGCRRVVANIKGKHRGLGPPVSDPYAIDWSAPLINWVPASFDRRTFEAFYAEAWAHRGPPTVLWDDELAAVTSPNWAPDGWLLIQQQGGEWDFGHLCCAQRCLNIKVEARTESEEFFIWPGLSRADLDWLAAEIGQLDGADVTGYDLHRRLRVLSEQFPAPPGSPVPSHASLRWVRATGELHECAPLDPGWVDAALFDVHTTSLGASADRGDELDESVDDPD